MRTHVEQVSLDGPVDEVSGEVKQHDSEHHHHDGPYAPQRPVTDQRCKTEADISSSTTASGGTITPPHQRVILTELEGNLQV